MLKGTSVRSHDLGVDLRNSGGTSGELCPQILDASPSLWQHADGKIHTAVDGENPYVPAI